MAIKRPDIYEHNNPNLAIADSNFVRGGGRSVADLTALYALPLDQLKERVTKVWVVSAASYYILKDIANYSNATGWEQEIIGSGTVTSISVGTGNINGISLTASPSPIVSTGTISLSGSLSGISNAQLTNSSITINGTPVSLGGSITVSAGAVSTLTAGTGLVYTGGGSYDGTTAKTLNIDTTKVLYISAGFGVTAGLAKWDGTNWTVDTSTYVTSVSGTSPIASSGGTTPAISISQAGASTNGYLSSTDWNTFNNKGTGTVTSVSGTGTAFGLTLTGTVTTSGSLTLGGTLAVPVGNITASGAANSSTFLRGDGSWATPTASAATAVFDSGNEIPVLEASSDGTINTYKIGNIPKFAVGDQVTISGFTTNPNFNLTKVPVLSLGVVTGGNSSARVTGITASATQIVYTIDADFTAFVGKSVTITGLINDCFNFSGGVIIASATTAPNTITISNPNSKNLAATLSTGTNLVTLTTGDTRGLFIGQSLTKTNVGGGAFGAGAVILRITGINTFLMGTGNNGTAVNHATAGSIQFLPSTANTTTTTTGLTATISTTGAATANVITLTAGSTTSLYYGQGYSSNNSRMGTTGNIGEILSLTTFRVQRSITQTASGITVTLTTPVGAPYTSSSVVYAVPSSYSFTANPTQATPAGTAYPNGTTQLGNTNTAAYVGTKYSITAVTTLNGLYAQYTTSTTHGYSVGDSVVISGITGTGAPFNGAGIITKIGSTTTFEINNNAPTGTVYSTGNGGTVLRQGYTTGSITGATLYNTQGRKSLRAIKPPAGAWISTSEIAVTDVSTYNFWGITTAGDCFRYLGLFTVPYDVSITRLAIALDQVAATGAQAVIGIYKMVLPECKTGYLISPSTAFISLDGSVTAFKEVIFSSKNIDLIAGDMYGLFMATKVAGGSPGFSGLSTSTGWAAYNPNTLIIGGTAGTGSSTGQWAANYGSSFWQAGPPATYSALSSLPNNLDDYQSLLNNTASQVIVAYLKTA